MINIINWYQLILPMSINRRYHLNYIICIYINIIMLKGLKIRIYFKKKNQKQNYEHVPWITLKIIKKKNRKLQPQSQQGYS